jgi:ribosomal protein S27E
VRLSGLLLPEISYAHPAIARQAGLGLAVTAWQGIFGLMAHTCPHCGAIFDVAWNKERSRDQDAVDCPLCGKELVPTTGSRTPSFRLIKLPEGRIDED